MDCSALPRMELGAGMCAALLLAEVQGESLDLQQCFQTRAHEPNCSAQRLCPEAHSQTRGAATSKPCQAPPRTHLVSARM